MCLVVVFAALPFRRNLYESFLVFHIALVILALVGCWYHLVPHFGFDYGYQVWLYISFAFWFADRLARFLRVAYYNRLGDSKAIVEVIPDSNIMQVTVFPRVAWGFGPAQHSFLYLPGLGNFWESHPFSVAAWKRQRQSLPTSPASAGATLSNSICKEANAKGSLAAASTTELSSNPNSSANKQQARPVQETQGQDLAYIRFLIRAHSGITSSLRRRLLSSPDGTQLELPVYTEGPYAGHRATLQPLYVADTVLCIAGGIGITHILGIVQQFATANVQEGETNTRGRNIMKAKRFILAWSAREAALIEHVKLHFLADLEGVEYFFWCTNSPNTATKADPFDKEIQNRGGLGVGRTVAVTPGRMNIESILRASTEPGHQTAVIVCAPGGMADEVTKQVVKCVRDGLRVDLVEETFAW